MDVKEKLGNELNKLRNKSSELNDKINELCDVIDEESDDDSFQKMLDEEDEVNLRIEALSDQLYELEKKERDATVPYKRIQFPLFKNKPDGRKVPVRLWTESFDEYIYKTESDEHIIDLVRMMGWMSRPGSKRFRRIKNRLNRNYVKYARDRRTVHIRDRLHVELRDCKFCSIYVHKGATVYITGGSRIQFIYVEKGAALKILNDDQKYHELHPRVVYVWYEKGAGIHADGGTYTEVVEVEEIKKKTPLGIFNIWMRMKFNRKPLSNKEIYKEKLWLKRHNAFIEKYKLDLSKI